MSASGTGYKRLVIDAHLALPIVWAPEAAYFAAFHQEEHFSTASCHVTPPCTVKRIDVTHNAK